MKFWSLSWCDTTFDILTSSQEGLVCHSKAQSTFCKNCQFCSITWVTFKTTNFSNAMFPYIINYKFSRLFCQNDCQNIFSENSIDFYARSQLTFWTNLECMSMFLFAFLNKISDFCWLCFAATTTGRVFHMKLGSVGWKVVSYKAVLPLIIIFHCRSPVCTLAEISKLSSENYVLDTTGVESLWSNCKNFSDKKW